VLKKGEMFSKALVGPFEKWERKRRDLRHVKKFPWLSKNNVVQFFEALPIPGDSRGI
jgi:hypothetical protein